MALLPGVRPFALAVVVAILLATPSHADDDTDTPSLDDIPHITMVGTAHVETQPDLATISIGVSLERPSAKAAADEVARRAKAVIDAAKAAGVADIDIATQSVTLSQTFDTVRDASGHEIGQRPRGFAADHMVSIKLRDLDRAGAVVEDLVAKGANRFDGVEFSVEHPQPIVDKLIGAAVKNARSQAEIATEAANLRLGRVLLIEKTSGPAGIHRRLVFAPQPRPRSEPVAMSLEAGTKSFDASVEVSWALEPR